MFDSYCIPTDPANKAHLQPAELIRSLEIELDLPEGTISKINRPGNSPKGLKPKHDVDIYTLRKVLVLFIRREYKLIYSDIAPLVGYKDHTTVVYSIKKAAGFEEVGDLIFKRYYSVVEKLCN